MGPPILLRYCQERFETAVAENMFGRKQDINKRTAER